MTKLTYLFLFLTTVYFAQTDDKNKSSDDKNKSVTDVGEMFTAKQALMAHEYVTALNRFREVENSNPNDAGVKYYVGLCYFNLKQFDNAKKTLEKAATLTKNAKTETHFLLGQLYQKEENFDKALVEFNALKANPSSDAETMEDCDVYINQCNNAKLFISRPLNVKVSNLGEGINSKYDDKNPCITADGSKLVFTTRRPETTNSPVDVEGDGKYFENIFIANLDSATKGFSKADGVSGSINTKAHDACTSISPDGKQIFIYYNDAAVKSKRGGNIFVSKVNAGKWRSPESLGKPVNTTYWEGGACVSPDGKRYFFSSERQGGYGGSDIWMVEKKSKTEWTEPVNLGGEINTKYDEAGMFLAPDGKTLFFCSNGPLSMGSYDVLKTVYENDKWSKPVNLGYPINTAGREGQLSVSADARYAYISSDRNGGLGENDIYKIELNDYAILEKDGKRQGNGLSILKGVIREGGEGYGVQEVEIRVTDAQGIPVALTSTNDLGEYFLTLKGGKYKLTVSKKGYQQIAEDIEVGSSEKETVIVEKGYLIKK